MHMKVRLDSQFRAFKAIQFISELKEQIQLISLFVNLKIFTQIIEVKKLSSLKMSQPGNLPCKESQTLVIPSLLLF